MNPMQAFANRTARLAAEAAAPVYSTETPSPEKVRRDLIEKAENAACTDDFCFICSRCTDHWGEHDDSQLLKWANTPLGKLFISRRG